MAARGGKRKGAGRKADPTKSLKLSASFAARLLKDLKHEDEIRRIYKDCGEERMKLQILFRLMEWEHGKPVQQIRMSNPEGEKFQVEVDLVSARDRLTAGITR